MQICKQWRFFGHWCTTATAQLAFDDNPMLALVQGFAIMLLVLAFNLQGNGLRDAVDVM